MSFWKIITKNETNNLSVLFFYADFSGIAFVNFSLVQKNWKFDKSNKFSGDFKITYIDKKLK